MGDATTIAPARTGWRTLIEAMRLHQWVKNLFVFAVPFFARELGVPAQFAQALIAFLAFCLASSAGYLLNDLVDLRQDQAHPLKKDRPLASGRLSRERAGAAAIVLAAAALGLGALANVATLVIVAVYLVFQSVYTVYLKHLVILDVMLIAVGFLLRILAGAAATALAPSYWLMLCTLNVALFLGLVKRRSEVVSLEETATLHRRVLEHYSRAFLDQMIAIVTGATLVCYILYTVDARTVAYFQTHGLVVTVPFVIYGLFRYLYLAYHKQGGGNPTRAMLRDLPFLANILLWAVVCSVIIYAGPRLNAWMPW